MPVPMIARVRYEPPRVRSQMIGRGNRGSSTRSSMTANTARSAAPRPMHVNVVALPQPLDSALDRP